MGSNQWSEVHHATPGLLRLPYNQEPVIRSPPRYPWTTAPALYTRNQWSEVQYATPGLLRLPYTPGTSDQKPSTLSRDYCTCPIHQEPVIRRPVRYPGITAPALYTRNQWSEAQYAISGLLHLSYTPGTSDQKPSTLPRDYCACPIHQEPVIRSPVRYLGTTAPALYTRNQWSEAQYATSGLLRMPSDLRNNRDIRWTTPSFHNDISHIG